MSHKLNFSILIIFLFIFASYTGAVEVESLYHVEIQVDDQSAANRQTATLEAFKEVLIRKSGSHNILSSAEVIRAYRKVIAYLQRFEYSKNKDYLAQPRNLVTSSLTSSLTSNQEINLNKAFTLMLDFEPRLIDELIQLSGMPIWGSNRPQTILWLAIESGYERTIIKDETENNSYSKLIKHNAIRRGIPIMLPIMDLDDQQNISISDVWGRFNSSVIQATERYAADSIVLGRIYQAENNWFAKLTYISNDEESIIEVGELTLESLFNSMINRIADLLCQKYCVVELAERHQVVIQVSNVTNFNNYIKINNYLAGLSAIRNVEIDTISGINLSLKLSLLGDIQAVEQALSLNSHLVVETPPSIEITNLNANSHISSAVLAAENNKVIEDKPTILYYRWVE